jgi:phosphoribosylformylglycinamidine cyclo-ligase
VRKVLSASGYALDAPAPFSREHKLADVLLTPTRLYVKSALAAIHAGGVRGFAHITGGGITENLPRILPDNLGTHIDLDSWPLPAVFAWLSLEAGLADSEMLTTFNCGLGLIAVVEAGKAGAVIEAFQELNEHAYRVGHLVRTQHGDPQVRYRGTLSK